MYGINIAIIYVYNEVEFLENLKLIWSLQSGISIKFEVYIKFIKFSWFGICNNVVNKDSTGEQLVNYRYIRETLALMTLSIPS